MKGRLKILAKSSMRRLFEIGQRCGVDVLPRHYYSEIPSIAELRRETCWRRPYSMHQVQGVELEEQLRHFDACCPSSVLDPHPQFQVHRRACEQNGEPGFGPVEANVLFAFVTTQKPATILQIGCGVSTAVILDAATRVGYKPNVICVEPYPTSFLKELSQAGRIELLKVKVQDEILQVQQRLRETNFFFVDSTHTLGPSGEVTRIVLELLPCLPAGQWAHFHDIAFPFDYGRRLLAGELFFWHESALLLAFLTMNRSFRIAFSLSMLHYECPEKIQAAMADYKPALNEMGLEAAAGHFPSSAYLKATAY
jgi:hypothetical protein